MLKVKTVLKLKLTELIESLSPSEMKRLGEFVRSPFYNKNKTLILLFDYFEKSLSPAASENITKENVWSYINPGKKYNDSNLRSVFSDFKKLCEEFLIAIQLEENTLFKKNILMTTFSDRNLSKNFEIIAKDVSEIFNGDFNRNYDFYSGKINYERTLINSKGRNIEKNIDENYFRLSDNIDYFFLSSKLELINSLLSRKYHVLGKMSPYIKFIDQILSNIEENLSEIKKSHPVIYSEYLILKMMTADRSEKYFNDLHTFVLKNINRLNQNGLEQVYFPLINYGFNKVALGENKFLEKIFEIYTTFEKKNFYGEMKVFQDIDFISIAIAGLRLNKFSWLENFAGKYSHKLLAEVKDDCINLVKAMISYKKKDYSNAVMLINSVNYQNSYYYLKSKEILMQIYYEQKEFESLQSLIDSTRHYLKRRQNVLSIHYERYMMYLKYFHLLLKANQNDTGDIYILKKELEKNMNVIGRDWLLEKVKEL